MNMYVATIRIYPLLWLYLKMKAAFKSGLSAPLLFPTSLVSLDWTSIGIWCLQARATKKQMGKVWWLSPQCAQKFKPSTQYCLSPHDKSWMCSECYECALFLCLKKCPTITSWGNEPLFFLLAPWDMNCFTFWSVRTPSNRNIKFSDVFFCLRWWWRPFLSSFICDCFSMSTFTLSSPPPQPQRWALTRQGKSRNLKTLDIAMGPDVVDDQLKPIRGLVKLRMSASSCWQPCLC